MDQGFLGFLVLGPRGNPQKLVQIGRPNLQAHFEARPDRRQPVGHRGRIYLDHEAKPARIQIRPVPLNQAADDLIGDRFLQIGRIIPDNLQERIQGTAR